MKRPNWNRPYVISAVLSNPDHYNYGQVTIPLPIPRNEYNYVLSMLNPLDIGDALKMDCWVDEIDSHYACLDVLINTCVNLDELDYLAKRLDSFCVGEDAQFQAMAEKMKIKDVKDLINLTFCCQQATAITDFSDLERIGKDHYMTIYGGTVPIDDLERLDGRELARKLIYESEGTITPYGVVYDNGMKLEQLYQGAAFPEYLYDEDTVLEVTVRSARDPDKQTNLLLPMTEMQIARSLLRAGINEPNEVCLIEFEPICCADALSALHIENEALSELNDMCLAVSELDPSCHSKLCAAVHYAKPGSAHQIKNLARQLDVFEFAPDVHTPKEYGEYMIKHSGQFEYDDNLNGFYDFEGYARNRLDKSSGEFNKHGYIEYVGAISIDELMMEDLTTPGFQMGEIV